MYLVHANNGPRFSGELTCKAWFLLSSHSQSSRGYKENNGGKMGTSVIVSTTTKTIVGVTPSIG